MQDYQSNSNKAKAEKEKEAKAAPPAEKNLEKVIIGEAVVQKKSLGRKAKDLIMDADIKGVIKEAARHMLADVLLPSAKNTAYDMWTDFGKRTLYRGNGPGPRSILDPRGLVQRITYNTGVQRSVGYQNDPRETRAIAPPIAAPRQARSDVESVIVGSKEEAEIVMEKMTDVLEAYEVVSVHDLKELLGYPRSHVDQKWGWISISDATIHQDRNGWIIEFSAPQPIQTT
jgi:hypothetical protein